MVLHKYNDTVTWNTNGIRIFNYQIWLPPNSIRDRHCGAGVTQRSIGPDGEWCSPSGQMVQKRQQQGDYLDFVICMDCSAMLCIP